MFDLDKWQEIWDVIRTNKLRTILTGFSVSWGIFILIILLGAGKGLENGIRSAWGDETNSMFVWGGQTKLPYKGFKIGRTIKLDLTDIEAIKNGIPHIKFATGNVSMWANNNITYGTKFINCRLSAVMPDEYNVQKYSLMEGRFINDGDTREERKTIVLNQYGEKVLFEGQPAIGEYVYINKIAFKVIGVLEDRDRFSRSRPFAYIPITIGQQLQNEGNHVNQISVSLNDLTIDKSKKIEEQIKKLLASRHQFDPVDNSAVSIWNRFESFNRNFMMIMGIKLFVLVIGLGTIIAGIVGVSNIMLISVKERTREIGIRKAIGAKPSNIIGQVLSESVLITGISGYFGLLAGIGLLSLANKLIPPNEFFKNPEVDFSLAMFAVTLLIIAGLIAGYVPARKAASVKPIEALRYE